jgi:acid phosphatase type 7
MDKIRIRRPLLTLFAIVAAFVVLYWQQNYRTIPDYTPPVTNLTDEVLPDAEKSVVLVAVGDISCSTHSPNYNGGNGNRFGCHMKQTAELARRLEPQALLLLGDLQYESGDLAQFNTSYSQSWGADDLKRISRPVPGNHEYTTKNAAGYFEYFGAAAGEPEKGYYSYDIGGWHIVALNSNCSTVPCGTNSEQLKWLQADLKKHVNKCSIAYFHHPLFSSGTHGGNNFMKPMYEVLTQNKVDITIGGHDHLYERFGLLNSAGLSDASGVRNFVVGTGGKDLYPFRKEQAGSEVRISSAFGVLKLVLKNDSYNWQFIDENNSILDAGNENCR